jgi:hypothetical protein
MSGALEPGRQDLQLTAGPCRARRPIRPPQCHPHERLVPLEDQGEEIALLMQLAALNDLSRLQTPSAHPRWRCEQSGING